MGDLLNISSQSLFAYHHHQSLDCKGHWGTTDDFATSFSISPHPSLVM